MSRAKPAAIIAVAALLLWTPPPAHANCHIATWDSNRVRVPEGAGKVELFVELDGGGEVTCTGTIKWETHDGSATAPADYAASKGELTWKPGDSRRQTIRIPIVDDAVTERSQAFDVTMTAGPGGIRVEQVGPQEGGPTAAVLIVDNDTASEPPTASPASTNGAAARAPRGAGSGSGAIVGIMAGLLVLAAAASFWLRRRRGPTP